MDRTHAFRKALLRRLLDVVGVASLAAPALAGAAGCGGKVFLDRDGNGSYGGGGNGGSASTSSLSGGGAGACSLSSTGVGGGDVQVTECVPMMETGCPTKYEATLYVIPSTPCSFVVSIDCGPIEANNACCYLVTEELSTCATGRPMIIDGEARTARAASGDGWVEDNLRPSLDGLGAAARAALVDAWTGDALLEHASIASFSRFSIELLAVGAPSELVAAAHRAALDEVGHAKLCFALAEVYRGAPVSPSAFPFDGSLTLHTSLAAMAAATAREGCIGETLSALLAAEQLARATDPAVRRALAQIAEDEARHAELAWRTVTWALERGGPEVRAAVSEVFGNAARHLPGVAALPFGLDADQAAAHGRLDREAARAALVRAVAEVVLPCADALLARAAAGELTRAGEVADETPTTQRSESFGLSPLMALRARG